MQIEKKEYIKGFIKEAITRDEYVRLVQNRQAVPAPARLNLGRTGVDTRQGFAGMEQYYGPVTPYYNPNIAYPGYAARRGQARWEDLPSTRMMMAANGYKMPAVNPNKMNAATRAYWDNSSTQAYNTVRQRAIANRNQTAESAAYDEILKRLNARCNADLNTNQERARRLAPLVARNYKRMPDGKWKSTVNDTRIAKVKEFARNLGKVTAPKQQVAQTAATQAPKASPSPAVAASAKPSVADASIKTAQQQFNIDPSDVTDIINKTKVLDENTFADVIQGTKDSLGHDLSVDSRDFIKNYIKHQGLRRAGLGGLAGLAAGGLSRIYDGDRKRGAIVGGMAGLATAAPSAIRIINNFSKNKDAYKKSLIEIEKALTEGGLSKTRAASIVNALKIPASAKLKMYAASAGVPLAIGVASGALSGALLGKKKKSVWEKLKEKFS